MGPVRVWLLTTVLACALACGEAHNAVTAEDDDAGAEPANDAGTLEQPDAGDLEPYVLCDGSDDVRFGVASRRGGFSNPAVAFTHPYGASFLYINGRCEYLAGEDRVGGGLVTGTLDAAQAAALEDSLELARLSTLQLDDHQGCDGAGSAVVATRLGFGYCRCGCDDSASSTLRRIVLAAQQTQRELAAAGTPPAADLEVGGFLAAEEDARSFRPWPIALDLTRIALPAWRQGGAYPETLPVLTVSGADADALRALRRTEHEDWLFRDARFVQQNGVLYELYVLDVVPARLAEAIARFPHTPRH